LLAPVYNWFTEGFDTPVLQDANGPIGVNKFGYALASRVALEVDCNDFLEIVARLVWQPKMLLD